MLPGIATDQTYVGGTPDFPGDAHAITFSAGGGSWLRPKNENQPPTKVQAKAVAVVICAMGR